MLQEQIAYTIESIARVFERDGKSSAWVHPVEVLERGSVEDLRVPLRRTQPDRAGSSVDLTSSGVYGHVNYHGQGIYRGHVIPLPISESNPARGRAAQFEALLAEILRHLGWRVHSQPRMADSQSDLIANHGRKKYVIELKASSEGRRDRIIPLASQAVLEVQLTAQQSGEGMIPVAVIAADHISDSVADQVKQFARDHAPNVGIGIIDGSGFRSFLGHGLESLNAERSAPSKVHVLAKSPSPANLFSDLNQWMLKVLLSGGISESLLSAPRGICRNASQLASAAGYRR